MSSAGPDTTIPTATSTVSPQIPEPQPVHLSDSVQDREISQSYPPPSRIPDALRAGRPAEGGACRPFHSAQGSHRVFVVPPRFGQPFDDPITTQPPPPYSAMSTSRQKVVSRDHVTQEERFDDRFDDSMSVSKQQSFFKDCLMHDGACTWYVKYYLRS